MSESRIIPFGPIGPFGPRPTGSGRGVAAGANDTATGSAQGVVAAALVQLYRDAVRACDAEELTRGWFTGHPRSARLFGGLVREGGQPVRLIAVGKAAPAMLVGAFDALRSLPHLVPVEAVCIAPASEPADVQRLTALAAGFDSPVPLELLEADHPLPSERSLAAGARALRLVTDADPDDAVLLLLSGGASALLEFPRIGVTLDDLVGLHEALLLCGAPIEHINVARAALSQIKLGGLAARCRAGRLATLALSDVCGDDIRIIGSGPTAPRTLSADAFSSGSGQRIGDDRPEPFDGTYGMPYQPAPRALDVLGRYGLRSKLSPRLFNLIDRFDRLPAPSIATRTSYDLVGTPLTLIDAAADRARAGLTGGLRPFVFASRQALSDDVEHFVSHYAANARTMKPLPARAVGPSAATPSTALLHIMGGEPSVHVAEGSLTAGRGGRSMHLAARMAVALADVPGWAFLAGASDGRDGATDGAGAVVDGTTAARLRALGEDPALLVQRFASLHFHERAGTLIPRWTTRTNVADLHMLFLGELA